jgi:hypothetical protein
VARRVIGQLHGYGYVAKCSYAITALLLKGMT